MNGKSWSTQDIEILKMIYPNSSSPEVAQILGRTKSAVYGAAKVHNLKKSDDYIKMELARQAERLKVAGKPFRRQKGFVPINKGVKMTEENYQKVKHTFFKKGHKPGNTKQEGDTRICTKQGYVLVKVADRVWRARYILSWEAVNGKVPKGFCLWHKNGNKTDDRLQNLEVITKAENANRNRIWQWPEELQTVIKLNNKIKRKLNEKHLG